MPHIAHQISQEVGVKPARQKRSQERLELMIKSGTKLIESRGYDGMRIAEITAGAGCSVGIFYERFKDKETFFHYLIENNKQRIAQLAEQNFEAMAKLDLPAKKVIAMVVEGSVHWFLRHKGLYCAALSSPLSSGKDYAPFRSQVNVISQHLVSLLAKRSNELSCPNLEVGVSFAIQMLYGTLVLGAFSANATSQTISSSHDEIDSDSGIHLTDPDLIPHLTHSICAYLGINNTLTLSGTEHA